MAKKKEEREIERVEFVDSIRNQINAAVGVIENIKREIQMFQKLYDDITRDQRTYNLKYFIVNDGLKYTRTGKKKIGF